MSTLFSALLVSVIAASPAAPAAADPPDISELRAKVAELEVTDVPWRRIRWRSCLLDGLAESRRSDRPVILWIFIDRPADDTRC